MAKNKSKSDTAPESAPAPDGPTIEMKPVPEGEEKKAGVGRAIIIKDPETGEDVKRVDWIRKVIQDKNSEYFCSRAKIATKLTELQGKPVPYQIVFAATKDMKIVKPPKPVVETAKGAAGGEAGDPLEGATGA